MRYLLINFIVIVCISAVSSQAISAVLLPTSKIARFAPQDWLILEKALWGKVYRKTTYGRFKLSKLWDREAIGTPEVQQLLASLKFPWHSSEVRIFDTGFSHHERFLLSPQARKSLRLADRYTLNIDEFEQEVERTLSTADIRFLRKLNPPEHGVLVAHLLAGKSPLPGISTRGKISLLSDIEPLMDDTGKQYLGLPGVVNLSKNTHTRDVDKLAPVGEKTLFVTAAGNTFPTEKSDNVTLASRALEQGGKAKIIPVGAINPDGSVSEYSVADRSIVVTAPGEHVFSFDGMEEREFHRTSAAAPAVSGVLADVRSILPQLTQNNAVQLLESTAIKTVTNEVSELNGAGVVNHYKMVRVALRLAEDGYDGELMPDNLDAYLDFSKEVTDLIDTSKNTTEFFLSLRRAFFLDPNNDVIRLQLADAYRQMELMSQANFYDLTLEAVKSKPVEAKLNQRAKLVKERLKLLPSIDQSIATNIISVSDLKIKGLIHLAEDDKAFEQLLKTIDAEANMVAEIVANERLPILTKAEIREQLATAELPAVETNIQLYLEKLELNDVSERKAKAGYATLSDFFKSGVSGNNLTDKEIAERLTGISINQVQVYKRGKLEEVVQKILHDRGFFDDTIGWIHDQLVKQEGVSASNQSIKSYLHRYLGGIVAEIVETEPYNITYSDKKISELLQQKTGIDTSSSQISKIRRISGIQTYKQRQEAKTEFLKGVVKEVIAGEKTYNPYPDSKIAEIVSTKTGREINTRIAKALREQLGLAKATERRDLEEVENKIIELIAYGKVEISGVRGTLPGEVIDRKVAKALESYGIYIKIGTAERLRKKEDSSIWRWAWWYERVEKFQKERIKELMDEHKTKFIEVIENNKIDISLNTIFTTLDKEHNIKIPESLWYVFHLSNFLDHFGYHLQSSNK